MLALKRLKKVALAAAAAAMVFTFYADSASKSEATVDTGSDPLVTLSYVNEVLKPQITNEIISQVNAIIENSAPAADSLGSYEVVYLTAGQTLLASESLELVLRSGEGTAVVHLQENISNGVGLSDLTAGAEITNGNNVPRNHYIIIPRADGRGILITSQDAYLMVRGEYEIVQD